jgi:hypothetical protein
MALGDVDAGFEVLSSVLGKGGSRPSLVQDFT